MLDLDILLENLRELSSEELQKKLWLHGNRNQMSTFTEAVCGIFDDARLTRALEVGYLESNFSIEICQKVEKLSMLVSQMPEDLPPEKIIKHPKMKTIRILAGELEILFSNGKQNNLN